MGLVNDMVVWWAGQMRDLLPARLRDVEDRADAVVATPAPGAATLTVALRHRGRETPVGTFGTDAAGTAELRRRVALGRRPPRAILRLLAGAVLERPVTLPLVTEPELDRVLAYELDRLSPFAAGEVFWTYAVERRDAAAERIYLRLALVPRAGVEVALGALRAAGLVPAGLVAPRAAGGSWFLGLDGPGAARPSPGRRRALRLAAAGCAALALITAGLPFLRQQRALDAAAARIAAAGPAVAEVEAIRRRAAERAGGRDVIAAEAARLGRPLEALAALTAILPDDTFLTALVLRQGVATLNGRSAASARLIAALSVDPSVRSAAFAAPVTRQEGGQADTRAEVFAIRVEFGS